MANILDPKPELLVKEIDDTFIKRNFINLKEFFEQQNQLLDFKFFTVRFEKAEKNVKVAHGISRTPKDIIFTSMSGNQQIDFNLGLFDAQNMDITVSGPCTISFFAGTYWKDTQRSLDTADILSFGSTTNKSLSSKEESDAGIILPFAGVKIPKGYLLCDGNSYKVADYPNLASALLDNNVYIWGGGNGSFNVPDLRGYFLRGEGGVDPDQTTRFSVNRSKSSGVGSYQDDALQRHRHQAGGNWFITDAFGQITGGGGVGGRTQEYVLNAVSLATDPASFVKTAAETRPKNAAVLYIIKT